MNAISADRWLEIMGKLQDFHGLFNQIWKLGRPQFSDKIPTAAVGFDRDGNCVKFVFNEEFYNTCSEEKLLFVICHEALHVWLNHGVRMRQISNFNPQIANIAMDLAINHMLVNRFGFRRYIIDENNEYCWVDTVFKGEKVSEEESSEWYYNKIIKNIQDKKSVGGMSEDDGTITVDDHDELLNGGEEDAQDDESKSIGKKANKPIDFESIIQEAAENISHKDMKEVQEYLKSRGEHPLGNEYEVKTRYKIKPKWETVIRKWSIAAIKKQFRPIKKWGYDNHRLRLLPKKYMVKGNTHQVIEDKLKNKIKVAFFLDTSGSCISLAERFFQAAHSLPSDKFEVELYCFDTQVYKTTLESQKVYGGGGTSFTIIEGECQKIKAEKGAYPEAVFIITDGFGDKVTPEIPEKWHWFMTSNYTDCFPDTCKVYNLEDFE